MMIRNVESVNCFKFRYKKFLLEKWNSENRVR